MSISQLNTKIIQIALKDRLDRTFYIEAKPNEYLASVLNRNHIPLDAVIVRKNGKIIDDWQERIDPNQEYVIEMVRAYHLPDFLSLLRLWDTKVSQGRWNTKEDSYYSRRYFWHNSSNGDYESTHASFNKEEFVSYIEKLFTEGIEKEKLIEPNEHFILAISGGRDSLSLGYLLNRTKKDLYDFTIQSVHVGTFSKPKETSFAEEIANRFGYKHRLITNDEVKALFNLKVDPIEALEVIKYEYNKSYSIGATHSIMRGAIEQYAREEGIKKIAYGLMCEDIMASIIKAKFIGVPFHGPFNKKWGEFELIYPLWPITKKELTLYLEAIVPEHNTQGSPTEFDRGALNRDIYYLLADTIGTIFPGAAYQLFKGHQKETREFLKPLEYKKCVNCGSVYNNSYNNQQNEEDDSDACDLCKLFDKLNLLKV